VGHTEAVTTLGTGGNYFSAAGKYISISLSSCPQPVATLNTVCGLEMSAVAMLIKAT
jgi:hypothetical protein